MARAADAPSPSPHDTGRDTGLFGALAPLVTDVTGEVSGDPSRSRPGDDPFQALLADIAVAKSRDARGRVRRGALLRAVAEFAETHAVAADLASEEAAIDLPLDVPDPSTAVAKTVLVVPDVIRACRDRVAAHAAPADRTKIDVVAMLFDRLLAESAIATDVRNTLARLQLPVLRMALADEEFFASRSHPTRRLLDRLAASAVAWREPTPSARAGLAALERVVHRVIRGSYEEPGEHARLLEEFEREIVDIATAASATRAEPPSTVEAEDRDVLVIKATIQISQLLAGVDVDREVRRFLLDVWSRVIVEIACLPRDGGRDALLARAKRLCFDLAWAGSPKTTSGERARLAGLLPTMIAAIRDGLRVIDHPAADEARFFAAFTRALLHAVRSAPGAPFRADDAGVDGLTIDAFAMRLREGSFGPEPAAAPGDDPPTTIGLRTPDDATPSMLRDAGGGPGSGLDGGAGGGKGGGKGGEDVAAAPIAVATLKKGEWFELRSGESFVRVRLSWVSPLRSFYLFIGGDSALTRSLDPAAIDELVARGELRRAAGRRDD